MSPRVESVDGGTQSLDSETETPRTDGWQKVVRRNRKGNYTPRSETEEAPRRGNRLSRPDSVNGANVRGSGTSRRRRPPRSAAVAFKVTDENISYAEILKSAREKVSLKDQRLGIKASRIRKVANGGILIEIPSEDGSAKEDNLAGKLQEAVGGSVQITRPVAKGEILLIGLDESVSPEEITEEVGRNRVAVLGVT